MFWNVLKEDDKFNNSAAEDLAVLEAVEIRLVGDQKNASARAAAAAALPGGLVPGLAGCSKDALTCIMSFLDLSSMVACQRSCKRFNVLANGDMQDEVYYWSYVIGRMWNKQKFEFDQQVLQTARLEAKKLDSKAPFPPQLVQRASRALPRTCCAAYSSGGVDRHGGRVCHHYPLIANSYRFFRLKSKNFDATTELLASKTSEGREWAAARDEQVLVDTSEYSPWIMLPSAVACLSALAYLIVMCVVGSGGPHAPTSYTALWLPLMFLFPTLSLTWQQLTIGSAVFVYHKPRTDGVILPPGTALPIPTTAAVAASKRKSSDDTEVSSSGQQLSLRLRCLRRSVFANGCALLMFGVVWWVSGALATITLLMLPLRLDNRIAVPLTNCLLPLYFAECLIAVLAAVYLWANFHYGRIVGRHRVTHDRMINGSLHTINGGSRFGTVPAPGQPHILGTGSSEMIHMDEVPDSVLSEILYVVSPFTVGVYRHRAFQYRLKLGLQFTLGVLSVLTCMTATAWLFLQPGSGVEVYVPCWVLLVGGLVMFLSRGLCREKHQGVDLAVWQVRAFIVLAIWLPLMVASVLAACGLNLVMVSIPLWIGLVASACFGCMVTVAFSFRRMY